MHSHDESDAPVTIRSKAGSGRTWHQSAVSCRSSQACIPTMTLTFLHGQETSQCACNTRVTPVAFDLHVRVLAKAAERERMALTPLSANRHSHDQGDRIKQLTEKMLQTDTSRTEIQDLSERHVTRSSSGAVQHRHPDPRQNQPHRSPYQPLLSSLI